MSDINRRSFLKSAAGVTAGVVGVGAMGTGSLPALAKTAKTAEAAGLADLGDAESAEHVVAYVKPGSRHEVTVLVGEREIVTRDPELARRLRRATR